MQVIIAYITEAITYVDDAPDEAAYLETLLTICEGKVCAFAKAAQVNCAVYLSVILQGFGFNGSLGSKSEQALKRRVRLGIYPIGLTALFVLFLILAFLFVSAFA